MKSVLISIQPKWCELIANGKKTVEVRKTKPKIDTPFKCYIYCTQGKDVLAVSRYDDKSAFLWDKSDVDRYNADMVRNGKVIGEFVCYGIEELYQCNSGWVNEYACISQTEFFDYLGIPRGTHFGYDKTAYGWHIDELVIYDKPKELGEFFIYCGDNPTKCDGCEAHYYSNTECGTEDYCCSIIEGHRPLKRPPQSWCYVEELAPTKIEHSSLCETDTYEVKE